MPCCFGAGGGSLAPSRRDARFHPLLGPASDPGPSSRARCTEVGVGTGVAVGHYYLGPSPGSPLQAADSVAYTRKDFRGAWTYVAPGPSSPSWVFVAVRTRYQNGASDFTGVEPGWPA